MAARALFVIYTRVTWKMHSFSANQTHAMYIISHKKHLHHDHDTFKSRVSLSWPNWLTAVHSYRPVLCSVTTLITMRVPIGCPLLLTSCTSLGIPRKSPGKTRVAIVYILVRTREQSRNKRRFERRRKVRKKLTSCRASDDELVWNDININGDEDESLYKNGNSDSFVKLWRLFTIKGKRRWNGRRLPHQIHIKKF